MGSFLVALVFVVVVFLLMGVRVVRQGFVYTIERLGKFTLAAEPGLHLIIPFIDRVGLVFLLALALAVGVSLATKHDPGKDIIRTDDVDYRTSGAFNAGAIAVLAILAALYTLFW